MGCSWWTRHGWPPTAFRMGHQLMEEGFVMHTEGMGSISSTGKMVSNMATISSSMLAAVDQEVANCRYERGEAGHGLGGHPHYQPDGGLGCESGHSNSSQKLPRKGYSCSHASQEGGGAGQQLHAPRPGVEEGVEGVSTVQGGEPVDALQVGECPWYPEPVSQFWVGEK